MKKIVLLLALLWSVLGLNGQKDFYQSYEFTAADTLRGALRPERSCYDVTFYDLSIRIDPEKQEIGGWVDIYFQTLADFSRLQIDLYQNMYLDSIVFEKKPLTFERQFDAVFVNFPVQKEATSGQFRVYYHGKPTAANNPPWDGGFVWGRDRRNRHWIGVACEGDGASLWWPNKDHLSDEPDSMSIRVSVPKGLECIANGNLRDQVDEGKYERWEWFVSYPINNYDVSVNIANYTHFADTYQAEDGSELALDYFVLDYNEKVAKEHFEQVKPMLACYEKYFGKYPFWEDGYALVETPYLGMEHQSAIAYGNRYMRGYLGGMIPDGMDWDYIIIHETGHEYFGNSISCNDLAEMWIHESFTTYMEALYVECEYSYEDAVGYMVSQRPYIDNEEPILGPQGVNWEDWGGSDHYYKGAWMLHTLRHALQDDELWFSLLKSFYQEYAISNVTTADFVQWVNDKTGQKWDAFFAQYLEYSEIPILEYRTTQEGENLKLDLRWNCAVQDFAMPVLLGNPEDFQLVKPTTYWQSLTLDGLDEKDFEIATDLFLIKPKRAK